MYIMVISWQFVNVVPLVYFLPKFYIPEIDIAEVGKFHSHYEEK